MTREDWEQYLVWRDRFAEILDPAYHTIEWLDSQVINDQAFLVACDDAAALVELRTYPTGAVDGHGLLCCGELSSIVGVLIPRWLEQLRAIGATSASISSREGWGKALKKHGFEPFQVAVRKAL